MNHDNNPEPDSTYTPSWSAGDTPIPSTHHQTHHFDTTARPTDPRQPAYDAVYAHIRELGDHMPPNPVHRNAMIWRAVHAALGATPVGRCVSSHCVDGDHVIDL
ncbi:hypothetical protein ACFFSH_40495, partial [Streptomyces filamentosus]